MALKWGIASVGKISHDFVNALGTLSDNDHQVVAVAARDLDRAEQFAKRFGVPKAYEGYLALAEDPDVEVVYIGNLNPQHFDVAHLMLEHGKHVLCEKPLCLNEKQSRKLISYAERKKLFLMEAIWSRFFPAYQYVKRQINSGVLGTIQHVDVAFGFDLSAVDRLTQKDLGGGTVLDLGVYVIQVSQWVFQQAPKSVHATGTLNAQGVDLAVEAEIDYGGEGDKKQTAKVATTALKQLKNTAVITGTKGTITIPTFWAPTTVIDIDGSEKQWPLPAAKYEFNFHNSCGLRYEAEEVRKLIRDGQTQSEHVSHNESLLIASIQDDIRKQIGVKFPEDE